MKFSIHQVNFIICQVWRNVQPKLNFLEAFLPSTWFSVLEIKNKTSRQLFYSLVKLSEAEDGKYIEFCLLLPLFSTADNQRMRQKNFQLFSSICDDENVSLFFSPLFLHWKLIEMLEKQESLQRETRLWMNRIGYMERGSWDSDVDIKDEGFLWTFYTLSEIGFCFKNRLFA